MYDTAIRIAIASAYSCDLYDNALKYFHQKQPHMKVLYSLYLVRTKRYPFWCCGIPKKILWKLFCTWWSIFNAFLSTCSVAFLTTHEQNNMCKCDTEGFVHVAILIIVVGSQSPFIRCLIGNTGKIWYVVYINVKWIHASETPACTIIECEIVCNVLQVTSTYLLVSWCSRSANIKWTPQVWHSSFKSLKVNWFPASAEILSKPHHPNSSIFPNIYWNI